MQAKQLIYKESIRVGPRNFFFRNLKQFLWPGSVCFEIGYGFWDDVCNRVMFVIG